MSWNNIEIQQSAQPIIGNRFAEKCSGHNHFTADRLAPKSMDIEMYYDILLQLEGAITSYLKELVHKRRSIEGELTFFQTCFSLSDCSQIDYDEKGDAFAYHYFINNFWKTAAAIINENQPICRRLIDAGCGSGASTIAYLGCLEASLRNLDEEWTIEIHLIDRSETQLSLAKEILEQVTPHLTHLRVKPRFSQVDLKQWNPDYEWAELLLLGHVLNEDPNIVNCVLEKAVHAVKASGTIFILERVNDTVWNNVHKQLKRVALPYYHGNAKINLDIHDNRLLRKPDLLTGYSTVRLPEEKRLAQLVQLYFQAWETRSTELLDSVFSNEAVYSEKPHESPLQGLSEIKRYWRENVLPQKNIVTEILSTAYTKAEAFVEWSAQFTKDQEDVNLQGVMVLSLDGEQTRIAMLREYFTSHRSPKGSGEYEWISHR